MKNNEINIRDPFVLPYDGKYYMFGTRGSSCWGEGNGFDCYVGTDLENWSDPIEVFHAPENFWADKNFWAPEVHEYRGKFYLFASFKADGVCRGTEILTAEKPTGPFHIHSGRPLTPQDWECLDGTFYQEPKEDGRPYMVFCHEWVQITDGTICAVALTEDLKRTAGLPKLLFHASEAPWIVTIRGKNYVTDGPFLYRRDDGILLMLWSSFGKEGYTLAVAESVSGTIHGPWKQWEELLFKKDGGHGMIFRSFDGRIMAALHSPNDTEKERPCFFDITNRIK